MCECHICHSRKDSTNQKSLAFSSEYEFPQCTSNFECIAAVIRNTKRALPVHSSYNTPMNKYCKSFICPEISKFCCTKRNGISNELHVFYCWQRLRKIVGFGIETNCQM